MAFVIPPLAIEISLWIGALCTVGLAGFGGYKIISDIIEKTDDKALILQF